MEEEKVRYKLLGKTGLKVSEIGFGESSWNAMILMNLWN